MLYLRNVHNFASNISINTGMLILRNLKKKLRLLDDEINAWQVITGQIIEDGMKNNKLPPLPTDFDGKTFALLRGKEVYYGMTSREVCLFYT